MFSICKDNKIICLCHDGQLPLVISTIYVLPLQHYSILLKDYAVVLSPREEVRATS